MRTRVKICGITRVEDARAAAAAGADAIGLVFYAASPRAVTVEQARAIAQAVPPFVAVVGLFVDAEPDAIRAVLSRVPLSLIQFHGSETPDQCAAYGRPYIKTIRMHDAVDVGLEERRFADAAGLLLDTFVPDRAGGSGRTFDWSRVPTRRAKPLVLAGGLTPENVGEAIRRVRPDAVDVSSGVEADKGVKDAAKIAAFIRAVQEAA
ncbi:MAG TPA: phosphoribosylanthranilate isomerase [Burkholderiales bacterium]